MTSMDLEIRHLRLVVAIADTGSVTRAGELLYLTQSALSHQLRDIEARLKTPLFHRVGKKMVLTTAGEELLRTARQVLEIVVRTEENIKRAAAGRGGLLRLTTECYTCYHWLPGLLKQYRAAHPAVDVQVDAAATPSPVKHLLDGRLDLAVMSTRVADRRLAESPLFEDDMLVIMSTGHRLASRPYITPEDFATETLLIYPPKEESTVINRVLSPAGVAPAAIQQVQLTEAIIELAKAGMGIAALARWAVEPYLRAGSLTGLPLTRKGYRRKWSAVTLRDMAQVPYMKDFIELLATNSPVSADRPRRPGLLRFDRPGRATAR
jgi:LysR family transcriptional regulator for metE and metH